MNLKTENGKDIFIYDNVFNSSQQQKMYYFILASSFRLSVTDDTLLDYTTKYSTTFGSAYNPKDIKNFGILEYMPKTIKERFNMSLDTHGRCLINNITPLDTHCPHDDSGQNVKWSMLYYANLKWDIEWGADTLFLTDDKQEISQCVQCMPNRVVVFDATIPHMIRPSTMAAPHHRWSVNMTFWNSVPDKMRGLEGEINL